jgi:predicted DNA-binding antitoxin AbrB/MazE fold protein
MSLTVEAIYENGVLKPTQPLPLKEHEKVRITVEPAISRARQTAGLLRWTGSAEAAEYFAMSPELDFPPPKDLPPPKEKP